MAGDLLAALFALILGLILCFGGYRFFLVMLPVWGFFAGFWLGASSTTWLLGSGFLGTTSGWVIGFIVGIIGAVLSYLFYMVGVTVVSASFGFTLGSGIMNALGLGGGLLAAVVSIVLALIMIGLVMRLKLHKVVIISLTAIAGANGVVVAPLILLGRVSIDSLRTVGGTIAPVLQDSWFWAAVWLALAIAGIFVQLRVNKSFEFRRERLVEAWG